MNTKTITTWIAQHKGRTALIALAVILLAWDWFAIPRLIIMMALPFVLLSIPLLFIATPVVIVVLILRRRARTKDAEDIQGIDLNKMPAAHQQAPRRRLSEQEVMEMYERYPERFEGVDLGDEIDRV